MLNLKFDRRKNKSLPEQLLEAIKKEVTLHHFATYTELADMKEFAERYQISLEEVKWIYDELINEKCVLLKDNKYYFTDFEIPSIFFDDVHSIYDIIEKNNYKATFRDLNFEVCEFPDSAKENFPSLVGLSVHVERLFYGDSRPVLLANFYYPLDVFPNLDKEIFKDRPIWDLLKSKYDAIPEYVKQNFHVVLLKAEEKLLLETDFDYAHNVKSVIKSQKGDVLEYSEIYLKIDEISFRYDIKI